MSEINWGAILVSVLSSIVIGSIWYGPLFGKIFMREIGMDRWSPERRAEEKKKMSMSYTMQFIASVVMFYVLAKFMGRLDQLTLNGGLITAFWVWLGFVVPVKLGDAIWAGNKTLFWLGIGNMLITLLAAGAIIGAW